MLHAAQLCGGPIPTPPNPSHQIAHADAVHSLRTKPLIRGQSTLVQGPHDPLHGEEGGVSD